MKLFPAALSLAAALCLTALETAPAQTPTSQFTDPANLRGERVSPLTGRELPIDQGASGLQQLLRKLNTRASLMLIVAHPDDEDGGMLTYYSRGLGARVADLSLNRGEGGQNAMTADFEDALGLLRTQELLSADRYFDADQLFGTEVDFGFSKTKEEAFAKWTHERVLYDVVRAIRIYRPLVIASVWIGGVTDGHGQHQASGQITQEAFLAAGDPKVFPELTAEGILPWQPLKVYARVPMQSITDKGLYDYATNQYTPAKFTNYVTGEITTTTPSTDVIIHEGTTDPLLNDQDGKPRSYVQFARIGLGLQKSQIGNNMRIPPAGAYDTAYHLYGSCTPKDLVILSKAKDPLSVHPLQNCHPERSLAASSQGAVEGPATKPVVANRLALSTPDLDPGFFNGIDTSIMGIENLAPDAFPSDLLSYVSRAIRAANEKFDPANPSAVAPALASGLQNMDQVIKAVESWKGDPIQKANALHELRIKQVQLNNALALALSLHLTAETTSANMRAGEDAEAKATLSQSSTEPILYRRMASANSNGSGIAEGGRDVQEGEEPHLTSGHPVESSCGLDPSMTPITRPYFTRDSIEVPVYKLSDPLLRNAPTTPYAFICIAEVEYKGVRIQLRAAAAHDNQPVAFVPADSLTLPTHAQVFPSDLQSLRLSATVTPFTAITVAPTLKAPAPWKLDDITYKKTGPNTYTANDSTTVPGETVWQLSASSKDRRPFTLTATANYGATTITEGYRPIGYGDLPITNYYTPATTRIVPVDLTLPTSHNIAYLPGTGDSVPEALTSINLKPTILTIADLTPTNLAQYDTVILGVRTYAAHPDLHGAPTQALLDYARNGGNVVVQYQTPEFTADDAPYPLSLGSNEKVVDETAPVALLPQNLKTQNSKLNETLLTTPNKITPADFNNWVEERGHGFLSTWDPHYTALTETHDPGQLPQRGGLITTPLGKGHWTYVAFALYRQLPEAVPGAYRLFVNLLTP